jgi:3D (Asp-Asp-Asp) domain-containing protein
METLPTRIFSLLKEVFDGCRVRAFVYIGVSSFVTFALMGLTCLFTYMRVCHDHELRMERLRDGLTEDIREQATEAARYQGEIQGYRNVISAFSRKGSRKPLGTFTVTAYDPVESCKPFDDGITAKALPAGMGVAAVDPGMIPYGSVLYLPGLEKYFLACDTGAAMKMGDGRNIDILMPTVTEAREFGRKRLAVELIELLED